MVKSLFVLTSMLFSMFAFGFRKTVLSVRKVRGKALVGRRMDKNAGKVAWGCYSY